MAVTASSALVMAQSTSVAIAAIPGEGSGLGGSARQLSGPAEAAQDIRGAIFSTAPPAFSETALIEQSPAVVAVHRMPGWLAARTKREAQLAAKAKTARVGKTPSARATQVPRPKYLAQAPKRTPARVVWSERRAVRAASTSAPATIAAAPIVLERIKGPRLAYSRAA